MTELEAISADIDTRERLERSLGRDDNSPVIDPPENIVPISGDIPDTT